MTPYGTLAIIFVTLIVGGIGVPIPEDVTLVGSGVLARSGTVSLWQAIVVGILGVCAGDWILYATGHHYGASMLRHRWIARLVQPEQLATVEELVQQRGAWAVFLARFVLGTRIVTFLSAGAFGMAIPAFAVGEATGSVLFASAMVTLGYLFAHEAERVAAGVTRVEHWLLLGGLVAIAVGLGLRSVAARWFAGGRR